MSEQVCPNCGAKERPNWWNMPPRFTCGSYYHVHAGHADIKLVQSELCKTRVENQLLMGLFERTLEILGWDMKHSFVPGDLPGWARVVREERDELREIVNRE